MTYEYNGSLFSKALAHHKDAGEAVEDMPDHDEDPGEHEKCVRAFHAHVKAMNDYCENYRRSIGMDDDHDVSEGDEQAETERRARRARQLRSSI